MPPIVVVSIFLLASSFAQAGEPMSAEKKSPLLPPLDASFLRTYAETRGFMLGRPVKPKPTPDGKAVLFLRSESKKAKLSLFEFDVAGGKTRELLSPEAVLKGAEEHLSAEEKARRERMRVSLGGFADFQLSEDGKKVLLSLSGKLYLYDRENHKVAELPTGQGTLLDPKFSPDGSKVAYVLDHDVYVYDLAAGREMRVTKGGTEKITHGVAEFVAQEEMGRFSGYWWSPDGKFIAYEEADHTGVEIWYVADPAKPGQKPLSQYYPRPGKKNVAVRLGIVAISGGEPVWVDWDAKKYEYLASVRWDKEGPLTVQVEDRRQQHLLLLLVDPKTGKTKQLLEERDVAFLNLHQGLPRWLPGDEGFLWISESGDRPALTLHGPDGKIECRLLTGYGEIQDVLSVDTTRRRIVCRTFNATQRPTGGDLAAVGSEESPCSSLIVELKLPDRNAVDRSATILSDRGGQNDAVFSKDHSVCVLTHTARDEMPAAKVFRRDSAAKQELIGAIPSVGFEPGIEPDIRIEQTGGKPGFYTAVIRPRGFDPAKKYPVIVNVYGGPHHLTVVDAMRPWLLMQWLADQGFIIVAIDNRGTPGRGRDWERAIYQKFGSVPLEDQVRGLQLLGAKHPEMDLERVGIVGWSFGGYMSALAVLKRPDVFKAAVAGAPVTDWEDYDSTYTERYLGLLPENKKAYEEASLLPLAPKLERPLLLVHGTADDNVYFRHTLRLTDALFRAGRDFEVLPLPSLTHMVPDPIVTERLWTRIAGHFHKHLGKAK